MQLTNFKDGIDAYSVSPNGKQLAFSGHEADPDEEAAKKEKRDFAVVDEKPRQAALYVVSTEAGAGGKRTHRKIASGDYHVGGAGGAPPRERRLSRWACSAIGLSTRESTATRRDRENPRRFW